MTSKLKWTFACWTFACWTLALLTLALPKASVAQLVLYDNFNLHHIDPLKWDTDFFDSNAREMVRELTATLRKMMIGVYTSQKLRIRQQQMTTVQADQYLVSTSQCLVQLRKYPLPWSSGKLKPLAVEVTRLVQLI